MNIEITELSQLEHYAKSFAKKLCKGDVVFLQGDLGSGKTTFAQMILKQLGYIKRVKSPTYAIYETYELSEFTLIHMDLYRLGNPEELFYLAIDDIFTKENIVLVEWPNKGMGVLPKASYVLSFEHLKFSKRSLNIDST